MKIALVSEAAQKAKTFLRVKRAQVLRKFDAKSVHIQAILKGNLLSDKLLGQSRDIFREPSSLLEAHDLGASL